MKIVKAVEWRGASPDGIVWVRVCFGEGGVLVTKGKQAIQLGINDVVKLYEALCEYEIDQYPKG